MRFATAILNFSKKKGGAEKYLADLCTRMAEERHDVHVYSEQWDEEDPRIRFHRVKTIPFPKSLRLLSFAIRSTEQMRKGHYDITLGVGNTLKADVLQPHGGVHWAWFWRSLGAYDNPLFRAMKFTGRMLSPRQWVSGCIENAPYRNGNPPRIVAISDMVKEDMIRWYKIPEDRITVVYNGVDIERFHPRNRQYRKEIRARHGIEDEIIFLFVSNNFRMKGLHLLLKALGPLKKEGIPFKILILGRDRRGSCLHLARKLDLSERIVFAGSTKEPEKYYGAADLLVHPSFYDACSLTVLEALASGLPVITSSLNGASGVISQGKDGLVIEELGDGGALREGIRFFLVEERRSLASRLARDKALAFSDRANFRRMMEIFEGVTGARNGKQS
jgi:UDP-glucose:(heptosyl)LPS alpha-1,3-glucosyltransferase